MVSQKPLFKLTNFNLQCNLNKERKKCLGKLFIESNIILYVQVDSKQTNLLVQERLEGSEEITTEG